MAASPGRRPTWSARSRRLLAPDPSQPRFFGRRKGRPLRAGQRALLDTLLPKLSIAQPQAGERLDPGALFEPKPGAVWLEIGFGAGEHLAALAERHPEIGFIGSEVFANGLGGLLARIEAQAIANIRIFPEDVRRLLPALPEASIAKAFLLFPDPWPKARHAERRFIGPDNRAQLARILADGAELRIASDHPVYVDWAVRQIESWPEFELRRHLARPTDWPLTRYESKARAAGAVCTYLSALRRARGPGPI
ncbi:MAG: tRNA (guanosine(46)-N7)-methyltransferase TrmB [Rhodospirillales bacterium]|nr:tRNA (guanosine(46)-N7)-methyltransferase TrmB [Rhodospirillales bacterium]